MEASEIQKSKHPCAVCAKRKVKCDRLIPCTNCVKRGFEKECLKRSIGGSASPHGDANASVLKLWQSYEYWVTDIGLFKSQDIDPAGTFVDLKRNIDECRYWCEYLTRDQSFKLLDYSIERLGCLYFGCLSDISDLYLLLEEYWQRRDDAGEGSVLSSVDDYYSNALLWSIFSLAVYYLPVKLLGSVFHKMPSSHVLKSDDLGSDLWTENAQLKLSQCFADCAVVQLHEADLFSNPDVRLIQVYLVLFATAYPSRKVASANALLLLCFNTAKLHHVNDFRPLTGDSTAMRLTKITCEKIWYSLCACDYVQSGPKKPTIFHTDISSLLQHAAYLEDLPNTDVYQSEDSFEALFWKVLSLDRDLDQYLTNGKKPPLKTLDAVQRQIDIFSRKISSSDESPSLASDFAKFLVSFLVNTVSWKLYKMYFIYYEIFSGLTKSIHHTKSLVALVVKNIKSRRDILFNKHPIVMWSLSRIATFYAFYELTFESTEVRNLNLDIKEVLQNLSEVLEPHLSELNYLLSRFRLLKSLWNSLELETSDMLRHPVLTILQNDIDVFSQQAQERPSMIRGLARLIMKRGSTRQGQAGDGNGDGGEVYGSLIADFESQYPIDHLIRHGTESVEL